MPIQDYQRQVYRSEILIARVFGVVPKFGAFQKLEFETPRMDIINAE